MNYDPTQGHTEGPPDDYDYGDDQNIVSNAAAGPARLETFAFQKSIAEAHGNASRVPKRGDVEDFEQIEVSRHARTGIFAWDLNNTCEGIRVEVEILDYYFGSGEADDTSEVELGVARIIESVSIELGKLLFRKDDVIPLTEAEEEEVRAQFLAHKRSAHED